MKRIGLLIVGIMIFITGCDKGRYVDIPKGYVKSEEYFDKEGIQDSSDYAKYIYNDEKVIEGIYDFDTSIITEGDYVRIETKEGEEIGDSTYGKYDNYSVYFFDRETLTLYYIHNNI